MIEDEKIPFTSHLEELRKRLITSFIAIGVGTAVSFAFKERLFNILVQPLIKVMEEGDTLKLIFDNASSGETIIQMCEQAGHEILEQNKEGGKIIFMIEKG